MNLQRLFSLSFGALMLIAGPAAAGQAGGAVTYKDVAPILRDRCVRCHAAGEMAPMALTSFKEVRPWARSIRQKVSSREMPPWYIDRSIGIQQYANDPTLTDEQIDTVVRWIDAGAPEGGPDNALPASASKAQGWSIGPPDLIVKKNPFKLYAEGSDWWQQDVVDSGLTEDRWIKAIELKPGSARIVHHFCANAIAPGGAGGAGGTPVSPPDRYAREEAEALAAEARLSGEGIVGARAGTASAASIGAGGFGCYLPGNGAKIFADDTGLLMKAGSRVSFGYAPEVAPLLPAGTMLHAIVVHDNTAANRHNPDPNRWIGYGQASTEEMAGTFVQWIELTPEDYRERAAARRAQERLAQEQTGR